jgi:CPA2 family monovalent cation:H+ antiporter-2
VIRNARALNPAIHVIVRSPGTGDVKGLTAGGADEVVQPEFEAGLEFVRQVLGWQGIAIGATDDLVSARRQTVYGIKGPDGDTSSVESDYQDLS